MRKLFLAAAALCLAACGRESISEMSEPINAHASAAAVCPGPAQIGTARCHARVHTDAQGNPSATATPAGWTPADLQSAYNLITSPGPVGQTVAIVDAYDDPTAEADLAFYRSQFGLPPCTTANGCFKKVNETGGTRYPRADPGWALEISLDLDMVSAACPSCKILLVEASTNSIADLGASENTAVKLGATAVGNSWGGSEYSGEVTDEQTYFNHLGVAITFSAGDSGSGVEFPAASRFVTAVGGTTLSRSSINLRGWDESAWVSGGCSAYITKPSWQTDIGCARRTVVDVAAVANPGAAVYDSTAYNGQKGWFTVGGTSLSAAFIAGVYGLAGNASSTTYGSYPYGHTAYLYDITTGGTCGNYLCQAGPGYDGPTGVGTPNGTGGF